MKPTDLIKENAEDLNIGDPVIITGNVQFKGKTGDVVDFGKDRRFVIVNLYNYGKHSFQSSDVSYNDYAESGDEQEYLSQFEENKTGTIFVGQLKGTDPASKVRDRLVGEARSLQSKFEKHLAKHGYDVNEKQKYWEKKIKDIDAQIAAWDAEMERRKQGKEMTTESNKPKFQVGDHVKFLYMQKPEIWREGRVVGFGRGDMVNVQGERNEYSVHTNLLKKAKQGVTEDEYEDGNEEGFFVAIGSEDAGGFVGMVYKEGGKWREQEVAGNAPYNWGASYMGYLSPGDVMQWIRQDYGRHSRVKGPFDTEEAAFDFASRMYGLGESVSKGLPGSLSRSDYMPGAVRHDLSNIKPKKTGPGWDSDRPVADIDPDWEKEQAAKRKKQRGVAEAKSLAKRVRVVKTGETGTIRQIKHGAYKGAAKTYYVDLDNGGQADNLPASALRLIKDDVAEGSDPTKKVFLKVNAINTGMPKGWHRVRRIELDPQRGQYYVEIKPEYGIYCGVENRQTYSLRNGEGMAITVRQADAILNDHQGVAEGRVDQLPTKGADYSKYDTALLKTMLRPGIMHRDEAKFKSLIRKELKKREQQGVAEGEEWDEYTGGAPFPDTDDLDTYGGEHDPDDLNESSGTEYRGFDIRASREYGTSSTIYWIYYRGRCTEHGNRTLDGAKKDIDRMIANGFFNDPDEEARKKQRGVAEGGIGKTHISPSGVKTNMPPSDDDYAINYGKNGLVAKDRKARGVDVKTGAKKVSEDAHSQAAKEIHDNLFQGTLNAVDQKNFIRSVLKAHGLTVADAPQVIDLVRKLGYAGNKFKEQGVAEGEYDPSYDPEYRGYSKPERNVDWDIEAKRNAPEEPKSTSTVTVRDNEGNVVLQFPSTGGYYGDLKYAANKGIDLEGGDYHANWQRNEDAMMSEASGVTSEQVASEIVRRIIFKHKDAISAFGPEAIMSAAREVGEFFAGSEELGTSDIGIATKYTLDKLEKMSQGALGESATGGATSAGAVATVPGGGKNVGSLFGGSYKQPKKKKK